MLERLTGWLRFRVARHGHGRQYCRQCRTPLVERRHNDDFCSELCDEQFTRDDAW